MVMILSILLWPHLGGRTQHETWTNIVKSFASELQEHHKVSFSFHFLEHTWGNTLTFGPVWKPNKNSWGISLQMIQWLYGRFPSDHSYGVSPPSSFKDQSTSSVWVLVRFLSFHQNVGFSWGSLIPSTPSQGPWELLKHGMHPSPQTLSKLACHFGGEQASTKSNRSFTRIVKRKMSTK